jgi:hypothetical protein
MPKILYIRRKLPLEQPDRCELCPLIGVIPKEERESGKRERYYCLGVFDAETDESGKPVIGSDGNQKMSFPRLKSKGICTSAKAVRAGGHKLHRPCDLMWDAWTTLPGRLFGMPVDTYTNYRLPYEKEQQVKNQPKFKFRKV